MKLTLLGFTYIHAGICIRIYSMSVCVYLCTVALWIFFQYIELHVFVPCLCNPIVTSNKSQTKCSVTREEATASLECIVCA